MIVYRFMHKETKTGPWTHGIPGHSEYDFMSAAMDHWYSSSNAINPSHSVPQNDGIDSDGFSLLKDKGYVCGCRDIRQVYHWFSDFWTRFCKSGFELFEIEIEPRWVVELDHQILLDLSNATSMRTISPQEYTRLLGAQHQSAASQHALITITI